MSALRPHEDTQPIPVVRGRHAAPKPKRSAASLALLVAREVGIVAAIVAVTVIFARLVIGQVAYVGDDAMGATLTSGERVLVSSWGSAGPGDVVLVRSPASWAAPEGAAFVRIIAIGGDRVTCCDPDGRITVNGVALEEDYVLGSTDQVGFDVAVPEGRVFVLVDDRASARDSRSLLDVQSGTLDVADVRGRAVAVLWPPRILGD